MEFSCSGAKSARAPASRAGSRDCASKTPIVSFSGRFVNPAHAGSRHLGGLARIIQQARASYRLCSNSLALAKSWFALSRSRFFA